MNIYKGRSHICRVQWIFTKLIYPCNQQWTNKRGQAPQTPPLKLQ